MRHLLFFALGLWIWGFGCQRPAQGDKAEVLGIEYHEMDTTADPSEDFYRYANGAWLDGVEIPGDRPGWGNQYELNENNEELLKSILDKALEEKSFPDTSDEYKAALFYQTGMDSALAESAGIAPLQPWFDKIAQLEDTEDLRNLLLDFEQNGLTGFWGLYVSQDARNNQVNALYISQNGIALPDRDYYLKQDPQSQALRDDYRAHIEKMLVLAGTPETEAASEAASILAMETRLAEAFKSRLELRDPVGRYNKLSVAELQELMPVIEWQAYFAGLGLPPIDSLISSSPQYLQSLATLLGEETGPAEWKPFLRWKVLSGMADYLSRDFVEEDFAFFSARLQGVKAMPPRWRRVLAVTNRVLGEPLGKLYVARVFPPEAKAEMQEMVENIRTALGERITHLDWMSEATKAEAQTKLQRMKVKIGYPDKWEDYQELEVGTQSFADNILKARVFNTRKNLEEYGQAPDLEEWPFPPQIVNAGYSPLRNEIVFPAGILQSPFYDFGADAAANYGSIGSIIGHEITHGFDDSGRRFDADGNLRDWWTPEDDARFKERAQVMVEQFNQYAPLDSQFVNGQLTLGENIADLGGLLIAYDAFQLYQKEHPGKLKVVNGFTPEQRFFISFGQNWQMVFQEETIRQRLLTDVHSPARFRAIGTLANTEPFFETFSVAPGSPMRRADSLLVRIW